MHPRCAIEYAIEFYEIQHFSAYELSWVKSIVYMRSILVHIYNS